MKTLMLISGLIFLSNGYVYAAQKNEVIEKKLDESEAKKEAKNAKAKKDTKLSTGDDDDIDDLIIERATDKARSGQGVIETEDDLYVGANPGSKTKLATTKEQPLKQMETPDKLNCGEHWSPWSDSLIEGVNPCPSSCEPNGVAEVQENKTTNPVQRRALVSCKKQLALKELKAPLLTEGRRNCGTHWSAWGTDKNANPCPAHCEPVGEPMVKAQDKSDGSPTQYSVRSQCVWKTDLAQTIKPKLLETKPMPVGARNCGTHWTQYVADPSGQNPCPADCDPTGEPLVQTSQSADGKNILYAVRYQCFYKGTGPQTLAAQTDSQPASQDMESGTTRSLISLPLPNALPGMDNSKIPSGVGEREIHERETQHPVPNLLSVATEGMFRLHVKASVDCSQQNNAPARQDWRVTKVEVSANRDGINQAIPIKTVNGCIAGFDEAMGNLTPGFYYNVWVSVHYADGTLKPSAIKRVRTSDAKNPENFTAREYSTGVAKLTWEPIEGARYYWLEGSGVARQKITDPEFLVLNLGAGEHRWSLVAAYGKEEVYNDLKASVATLTLTSGESVAAADSGATRNTNKGRYRLTLAGFTANYATNDNPLQLDGKGDEVFATVGVQILDENGNSVTGGIDPNLRSHVYGDTFFQNASNRRMGGQISDHGGIGDGHSVPALPYSGDANSSDPLSIPLVIWSGELEDGKNSVIVTPVLWEFDGSDVAGYVRRWSNWFGEVPKRLFPSEAIKIKWLPNIVQIDYSKIGPGPVWDLVEQAIGTDGDRPIGMQTENGKTSFKPKSIALNFKGAEALLKQRIGNLPIGVYPYELREDSALRGNYTVYLKLEKLP